MTDRLSGIEFDVTYKLVGNIAVKGVSEKNIASTLSWPDQLENLEDVKVVLDKISPNRVLFECPIEGCDLRWVHKVLEDDVSRIPVTCAYCSVKAKREISNIERTAEEHRTVVRMQLGLTISEAISENLVNPDHSRLNRDDLSKELLGINKDEAEAKIAQFPFLSIKLIRTQTFTL